MSAGETVAEAPPALAPPAPPALSYLGGRITGQTVLIRAISYRRSRVADHESVWVFARRQALVRVVRVVRVVVVRVVVYMPHCLSTAYT